MRDALLAGAAGIDNVWVFTDGIKSGDLEGWSIGGGFYSTCKNKGSTDCDNISHALNGAVTIVASGGALTANKDTLFDQFVESWHNLDNDNDFQTFLAEKSLKFDVNGDRFVSDGNPQYLIDGFDVPIPAGIDMSVYNDTVSDKRRISKLSICRSLTHCRRL
jgi:hypothetical protein